MKRRPVLGTVNGVRVKSRALEAAIVQRDEMVKHLRGSVLRQEARAHGAEAECARRGMELAKLNQTRWVRLGRKLGFIREDAR